MTDCERPSDEDARCARQVAVDIDLRCALAFSRTAVRALAALSEDASALVDEQLAQELSQVTLERADSMEAVSALLEEMRSDLKTGPAAT
jgi:hypothetical protein